MAAKSRIKWFRIWLCFILLSTMLLAGASLFKPLDCFLYAKVAPHTGGVSPEESLLLLQPGEHAPVPDITLVKKRFECPTVAMINLRPEQVSEFILSDVWSVQVFAPLLKQIADSGVKNLALSAPCIWEGGIQGEAGQMMLAEALSNHKLFEHVVLGVRGRTKAMAEPTPIILSSGAIPTAQVQGDVKQLPFANCKLECDLDDTALAHQVLWAPDWLEDEEYTQSPSALDNRSFPLLMRWNGEILPTLPLRMAMEVRGCSPNDVYVVLGKEIRIGDVTFPIDQHSRLTMEGVSVQPIDLMDVFDKKAKFDEKAEPYSLAVLMEPLSDNEPEERLKCMAATLSQLCAKVHTETMTIPGAPLPSLSYQPLIENMTLRIVVVVLFMFVAVALIPAMPGMLKLVVMFGWFNWIFYKMWSGIQASQWHSIGVMLAVWLVLLLAIPVLKPEKKRRIFSRR